MHDRRWGLWLVAALLAAAPVSAADAPAPAPDKPQVERGKPTTHNTACSLGESIASKLGGKSDVTHEVAERSCNMLMPSAMKGPDRDEFMRCCTQRLDAKVPAGGAPAPKPAAPAKPGT